VRVVDASPLITLAKVGRLDLLEASGLQLVVPEPVAQEVRRGDADDAARVLGVRVTGTLGIVISAAQAKRIDRAAAIIHALRSAGLRVDDGVVADALSRYLGERWDPR
jgi:predicted nucleic acid-binding protein